VLEWSAERVGRYVCLANVHMAMEAFDDPAFRAIVERADLVLPDGMPLVWAQRLLGHGEASRVFGPDLMERVLERAAALGVPVGFYGGSPELLQKLREVASVRWPRLRIAAAIAPPFRALTPEEDLEHTRAIDGSGARVLFVGIGCPRQEQWMSQHVGRVSCPMLGVGQAFDLVTGVKRNPPRWMHDAGLGWVYRLVHEPRRLWRRYAANNPRFLFLFLAQWLAYRRRETR